MYLNRKRASHLLPLTVTGHYTSNIDFKKRSVPTLYKSIQQITNSRQEDLKTENNAKNCDSYGTTRFNNLVHITNSITEIAY